MARAHLGHPQVLQFTSYFREAIQGDPSEAFRIRRCTINYYLDDDTMQLTETLVPNSGTPCGTFVKRHRIPLRRGLESSGYVGLDKLRVGEDLNMCARIRNPHRPVVDH